LDPGPKYQVEVLILGRPGIRASRDLNPSHGSADLFRATHHGFQPKFLAVVSRQGPRETFAWRCGLAGFRSARPPYYGFFSSLSFSFSAGTSTNG
jgi:hypothetical protein